MRTRVLDQEVVIDHPLDEVFEFFSKAENLEKITPSSLSFEILTGLPLEMKPGTLIDYRIRLMGLPMRWRTLISTWDPPFRFVDEQLKGPYVKWIHTHTFSAEGSQTRMRDHVEYLAPGWILEPLIHALFVGPQVKAIFEYRSKVITEQFKPKASFGA